MVAVSFVLSGNSGTTERVFLDKSLVGKFSAEMVSDGEKLPWFLFMYMYIYIYLCFSFNYHVCLDIKFLQITSRSILTK